MSNRKATKVSRATIDNPKVDAMLAKLVQLRAEKKILDLRYAGLEKRIEKVEADLKKACPHVNVDETSYYFGGSYDEVARTFYSHVCIDCGKKLKEWDKSHGHYG